MVAETRYMRSDQHTINGLEAYKLSTSESSSVLETDGCTVESSGNDFFIGIRVYVVHADESETEITSAASVAIATLGTNGDYTGDIQNTWECPETALAADDAIKIEVRCMCGIAWNEGVAVLRATLITEQLAASQLDNVTWTVTYRVRRDEVIFFPLEWWDFYFRRGDSGDSSYISDFTYTLAPVAAHPVGDGLTFAV